MKIEIEKIKVTIKNIYFPTTNILLCVGYPIVNL